MLIFCEFFKSGEFCTERHDFCHVGPFDEYGHAFDQPFAASHDRYTLGSHVAVLRLLVYEEDARPLIAPPLLHQRFDLFYHLLHAEDKCAFLFFGFHNCVEF